MAGLVPAIHVLPARTEFVDARAKHSLASDQFRPFSDVRDRRRKVRFWPKAAQPLWSTQSGKADVS